MTKSLKLFLVVTVVLLMFITTTKVSANSGPPISGITIEPDVCEVIYDEEVSSVFPNNFDILVQIDDFEPDLFVEMTEKYKTFYSFYEDIDYLNEMEPGWTSFSASYLREDSWGYSPYCGMQFGTKYDVEKMEKVILVYFDDNGDTLFKSEEMHVPEVLLYQHRDSIVYFNTTTLEIDSRLNPTFDPFFIVVLIGFFFLIMFSVLFEVFVAIIFKLKTKKLIWNIIFINFMTQAMMYVYFYLIYNPHGNSYMEHLFFYEMLVLIVEFSYLYWKFNNVISWKKLMLYVAVANVVSYVVGLLRYL